MLDVRIADAAGGGNWQSFVLKRLQSMLTNKAWCRDIFLRGSMAQGAADDQSDIDLVVTVPEHHFAAAIGELTTAPPAPNPGQLPPWVDVLVPDFGGIGFAFLLQVAEQKWGHIDIYLLPQSRRQRLLDRDSVLALRTSEVVQGCDDAMINRVDDIRQHYQEIAAKDLQQAVLWCYVAASLLRKRFIRGNRFQAYADKFAFADCVKNLAVLACYPDRQEQGWRALSKVAARSPDPERVLKILSIFAQEDVLEEPSQLASRMAGLEEIVALLAPVTWREHGESLRNLGRYLLTNKSREPRNG